MPGGFLNAEGLKALEACRETAGAHFKIAASNAQAVDALIVTVNQVNRIGELQTELAEFQIEQLREDRRAARIEGWVYKITTLLLAGAAL